MSQVQLCQGLLQTDAGDVVMDSITLGAAELPVLPGALKSYALLCQV
jgi:hypothetical protein